MAIDPTQTLRDAAATLWREEGLATADPGSRWVWIRLGPFPFAYPNTKGRRRLLLAHDLHHALAGYGTGIVGEAETAAWEFGTGMRDRSAVRYAIRVFGFVRPFARARLWAAFVRGRECRNLLDHPLDESTLSRSIGELRRELGLERPAREPNAADRHEFRRWSAKAIAIVWGPLVPIAVALAWWLG